MTNVIPCLHTFIQKWGIDCVPHDIRASMDSCWKGFGLVGNGWPADDVVLIDNLQHPRGNVNELGMR